MRKVKIQVTKTVTYTGSVEVQQTCFQDSKELACEIAAAQDKHIYLDFNAPQDEIKVDGKIYRRIDWSQKKDPTYRAEVRHD